MNHTAVVIDVYDDNGNVLKEKVANLKELPDFVRGVTFRSKEFLDSQPDSSFACVMNQNGEKLRKYACLDKGHTALNVIYFLDACDRQLPAFKKEASKKIAENLLAACSCFGLTPPKQLTKIAENKLLIQGDGAEMVVNKTVKKADLSGTDTMPMGPYRSANVQKLEKAAAGLTMRNQIPDDSLGSWKDNWAGTSYPDTRDPRLCALVSEHGVDFPLVTYRQVKEAADFFKDQGMRLHPRTRRDFCVKLAARANVLGIDVDRTIKKYGSAHYANDNEISMHIERRKQLWMNSEEKEGVSLLDALMEKRASLKPEEFAEALAQVDIVMGADRLWNKDIADPWYTTLGKLAEDEAPWSWQQGTEYLTEAALRKLATNGKNHVTKVFGGEMADALEREPISIFDSLPLEQKTIIARMAQSEDSMM